MAMDVCNNRSVTQRVINILTMCIYFASTLKTSAKNYKSYSKLIVRLFCAESNTDDTFEHKWRIFEAFCICLITVNLHLMVLEK